MVGRLLLDQCIEEGLSARRIKKENGKRKKGGRRNSRTPLLEEFGNGRVTARKFSASTNDSKSHIKWLQGQLKKVSAELDKLAKKIN